MIKTIAKYWGLSYPVDDFRKIVKTIEEMRKKYQQDIESNEFYKMKREKDLYNIEYTNWQEMEVNEARLKYLDYKEEIEVADAHLEYLRDLDSLFVKPKYW